MWKWKWKLGYWIFFICCAHICEIKFKLNYFYCSEWAAPLGQSGVKCHSQKRFSSFLRERKSVSHPRPCTYFPRIQPNHCHQANHIVYIYSAVKNKSDQQWLNKNVCLQYSVFVSSATIMSACCTWCSPRLKPAWGEGGEGQGGWLRGKIRWLKATFSICAGRRMNKWWREQLIRN